MLRNPNGVAFHNGSLYVAEIDRILRYDGIESNLDSPPEAVEVARLPYYITARLEVHRLWAGREALCGHGRRLQCL